MREENRVWFEKRLSKRRRIEKATEEEEEEEEEAPMLATELQMNGSAPTDEMRVVIKVRSAALPLSPSTSSPFFLRQLDITLDSIQLVDKFEWDISNPHNSPEAFAEAFTAELGLTGEFR